MLGPAAIRIEWRLGDGARLLLLANFGDQPVPLEQLPAGRLLYASAVPPVSSVAPVSAAFFLAPVPG
jgi:hypothetical protein